MIQESRESGQQGIRLSGDQDIRIEWIDGFVKQIRKYVYVRELDSLLILVPNQAFSLNQSGVSILNFLLKGNTVAQLLSVIGDSEAKRREIHYFFCDLRAMLSGCLKEGEKRAGVSYSQFNGDLNAYPVLSEIAVTYRCNLKCDFCYVGERKTKELNTNDWKKILYKIYYEARVPSVSFTGGEPLLRNDIIKLVEYANGIGLWTNLITNGTLLGSSLAKTLKSAGLKSAQISLEGPQSAIHDNITGIPGSFQKTISGIM